MMTQFIDTAIIEVSSGDGGNGLIGWRREKYEPMGGPAGGDGGRGGSVYIEATSDLNTLVEFKFKRKFVAENGKRGGGSNRRGAAGADICVRVPVGTVVFDAEDNRIVGDFTEAGEKLLVAEGGRGGRGNAALASPTRRAPYFCEPGERGIRRELRLELKLLADVGLVGLPNAGKSTVLSVLSAAKPKIADYPFSTLSPNLGVVRNTLGRGFVIADIPGLIKGASTGIGLGHEFLRHIERSRVIVHVVDIGAENIAENIATIEHELASFDEALRQKPQVILLNKTDLFPETEARQILERIKAETDKEVIAISAVAKDNLEQLIKVVEQLVRVSEEQDGKITKPIYFDHKATDHGDQRFNVFREKQAFCVEGDRINQLVSVTDARSPESLQHLNQILRSMGVIETLLKEKISPGDEVKIAGLSFTYGENLF
jgi:GTP-binding protein